VYAQGLNARTRYEAGWKTENKKVGKGLLSETAKGKNQKSCNRLQLEAQFKRK